MSVSPAASTQAPAAGRRYVGRFAPSPTGPLHAGSLVAALASWLDARSADDGRGGIWLVRIEDVDTPRCQPGAAETILRQLADCGLVPDGTVWWQSARHARYAEQLEHLAHAGLAYPCACTRADIERAHRLHHGARDRHSELPYPGTCRNGLGGRPPRSWRFRTSEYQKKFAPQAAAQAQDRPAIHAGGVAWTDRRLGPRTQDVAEVVGDFVLRRADGLWAYQLAVVVDDADQGVTHVVRGEDLLDNTPRQILLRHALGAGAPSYLHTPLVRAPDGEKLSKQHGAPAVDTSNPLAALRAAAGALGLPPLQHPHDTTVGEALAWWAQAWPRIYNRPS
ncbi:tRNA glutamyl-Q(34) synthetase GluQRS [Paracidovorax citrulli]|uniref:Glutamyl-Q tRNA(Asp) synthetase n=2 Tax=Paracidovorax citrulli TaxID=80869 RepID=A1TRL1_PARC0|nr:tRNA glutamyl-Q(34) synthetase GluQRS [Paracidovorax citrulli]ABM33599.1 Glutamate--tRNA ligase [Paracidovorax citrulli AAC00-1]ATG94207.1 tRNA glutamyl-Q(34) synthetase GluQRS [Paracidovorax citrulli]PVY63027.1 glutamyl-Q tRNA(Asp) synthetase [Paracidovorax citrulli]QCX12674.1 Glutamyl-Q tRNA(Asp) synthetase [Paracidovorax citrulli]REG67990.1 glutamyl-Q tRNA(Asp) synthetase [Paracidovorax citrulli]